MITPDSPPILIAPTAITSGETAPSLPARPRAPGSALRRLSAWRAATTPDARLAALGITATNPQEN